MTRQPIDAKRTTKKRATKKEPPGSSPESPELARLPPPLRHRAEKPARGAEARLGRQASDALARAKAALAQSARNLYEAGLALVVLKRPGRAQAAGFPAGYYALCKTLGLSRTVADRLTDAVAQMSQEQYADFKADRADALLDLASATEADDTTAILAGHRIRLWKGGPALSVRAATTAALRDATKDVRAHAAATSTKPHRGRSATPDERSAARSATERLRGKGSRARVAVRATQPGKPSVFDIIGLSAAELDRSLAAIARGKSRG